MTTYLTLSVHTDRLVVSLKKKQGFHTPYKEMLPFLNEYYKNLSGKRITK